MADTPIQPFPGRVALASSPSPQNILLTTTIGALALAGIASAITKPTVTSRVPTVASVSIAGVTVPSPFSVTPIFTVETPYESGTVLWGGIVNGAVGMPSPRLRYRSVSLQAYGTFGTGGSIKLQGSNDGTNWWDLSATALTSAGGFAALGATERPKYIRPSVTAGDGTTALSVVGWFS